MKCADIKKLYGFYHNELEHNILSFWLERCVDTEYGGFVNCYDNRGERLVSYDKYTWSQGRFVWMFARLSMSEALDWNHQQRARFLEMARQGARFLMEHSLMGPDDWRCVFLMDRTGKPREVEPGAPLDMSIYADCFVVAGLAMLAAADGDRAYYVFAQKLYHSVVSRVDAGCFHTLPYPLSDRFRAHGIPMILSNVTRELYRAAEKLDPESCPELLGLLERFAKDILTHFVDENHAMHEVITKDNAFIPQVLGQHMNPGHTIEDVWFLLDAAQLCNKPEWEKDIFAAAHVALENGWDKEFGGLLHFCGMKGGRPTGDESGVENEPMTRQLSGWDDKLWWVHSEALYTTLRCYFRSGDPSFLDWHDRLFAYVFDHFPNPDRELREWLQILKRDGTPQDKVVALPVKDPYHITRDLVLILELLHHERMRESVEGANL